MTGSDTSYKNIKTKYKNIKNGSDESPALRRRKQNEKYADIKNGSSESSDRKKIREKYRAQNIKSGNSEGSEVRLQRFKYDHLHLKNGTDANPDTEPYSEEKARRRLRALMLRRSVTVIAAAAAVIILCRLQFGPAALFADISAYADEEIAIIGLLDDDFTVTPEDLTELDLVRETAVGNTAKAGTVQAIGPTLETFVAYYGRNLNEFEKVSFSAGDDYTTSLVATLEEEIILSIANGRESLEDTQQPLRIVIPNYDSKTWIRMVDTIEFTEK